MQQPFKLQRQEELSHSSTAVSEARNKPTSVYLEGEIEGMPASFLIDTGSTISIIGKDLWDQLLAYTKNIRLEKTNKRAYTANNQPLTLLGATEVNVQINKQTLTHRFIVAQDAKQCILGMDYLQKYTSSINFEQQTIKNKAGNVSRLKAQEELANVIRVVNSAKVVLRPKHELVLQAKLN